MKREEGKIMGKIIGEGITFDDVLLVPGYSEVIPNQIDLRTHLTKDIQLNIPMMSAGMDTVTEHRMAIAMAREKGIKTVRLDVLEGNLPAEKAYGKVGFQYVDTVRMFYEDTGWTNYKLYEYIV